MKFKTLALVLLIVPFISCNYGDKKSAKTETYPDVKVVGAMKNVMWNGALASSIDLDTIADKNGLYGLGPQSFLTGELLINDGKSYLSKVTSDSTMNVQQTYEVSAPFFVYTNVTGWEESQLPATIKTIPELEKYIDEKTSGLKRPFAFKLKGEVARAVIHILNLPEGSTVSSPTEAHQGQTNYTLSNQTATIIGIFSTEHKAVFTHHDSFVHMHLITEDEKKMGHLDELEIGRMKLYLPKE